MEESNQGHGSRDITLMEMEVVDEDPNEQEVSRVNICCCIKPNDRSVGFGSSILCSVRLVLWMFFLELFVIIGLVASFIYTAYLVGTNFQEVQKVAISIIGLAIYSFFVYKVFIKKRIPRFCCGKRRFTKSHKHSLVSILQSLHVHT